jgi:ADP-heptose:LPS heptosyltransferase
MKLLTASKRNIAIFFTGGLGDTILYIPLIKELKKKNFSVTGIFFSNFKSDCLFDASLIDSKVYIKNNLSLLIYSIKRFKYFANIYISHLSKGNSLLIAAHICSERVSSTDFSSETKRQKRYKKIVNHFTDAEQNLNLLYSTSNASINTINSFWLPKPILSKKNVVNFMGAVHSAYYIIQISSGNNTTPFKNWPLKNWISLVTMLCKTYSNTQFVLVGDANEIEYSYEFENLHLNNCKILIGKTSIEEVFSITAFSNGYMGLDSGIMHLAVALQKKTISIFGASNEKLYGYSFIDETNHKIIKATVACRPCSSWKNANQSRVTNPLHCPDFACLNLIEPSFVFEQIVTHFNL